MKPDRKKGSSRNPATSEVVRPRRSGAEDAEPSAQRIALPVWFFVVLGVGVFWGMTYLDNNAGGFSPVVYQRFVSSNYLGTLRIRGPEEEQMAAGLAVYNKPTCVACHQPNGLGGGANPPLAGSEWVLEPDPARLIRIVLHGLQGPIEVKGQSYNAAMLPWKDSLTDAEIANVLTYIRKAWGNDAPAVTTNVVTEIRETTSGRNTSWTGPELQQIPVGVQ